MTFYLNSGVKTHVSHIYCINPCFSFLVVAVEAELTDCEELREAVAGDNLTVWSGPPQGTQVILSCDNVTLVNFDDGDVLEIKENIQVKHIDRSASVIIMDIQKKDALLYKLQVYGSDHNGTTKYIRISVNDSLPHSADSASLLSTQHPSPLDDDGDQRSHLAAFISAGLLLAGVVTLIIAPCLKTIKE